MVVHDLVADKRRRVQRYMAELTLAGLFRVIRRFRAAEPISYVAFEYEAPDYAAEYQRIFEGRARFGQPFTGLRFGKGLLDAAAPYPDQELHHTLWSLARRRLAAQTTASSCAARIHDYLVWQVPPRDFSMPAAARALGMSVRTLRRHLAAERRAYTDVVTHARAAIAKSCLRDERLTIEQTAAELGFCILLRSGIAVGLRKIGGCDFDVEGVEHVLVEDRRRLILGFGLDSHGVARWRRCRRRRSHLARPMGGAASFA